MSNLRIDILKKALTEFHENDIISKITPKYDFLCIDMKNYKTDYETISIRWYFEESIDMIQICFTRKHIDDQNCFEIKNVSSLRLNDLVCLLWKSIWSLNFAIHNYGFEDRLT